MIREFLKAVETNSRPPIDIVKSIEMTVPGLVAHESKSAGALFWGVEPTPEREVFDLGDLQGLTSVEIAERLGIEPVSVRAHLFKARRALRARILEHHAELAEEWT